MHDAIAAHKRARSPKRIELGQRYLDAHPGAGASTCRTSAPSRSLGLIEETRAAREEAIATAKDRASQHDSGSLHYPALRTTLRRTRRRSLRDVAVVLAPIIRYCGMLPVLFNFFVTRAYQDAINERSAHHFHMDPRTRFPSRCSCS